MIEPFDETGDARTLSRHSEARETSDTNTPFRQRAARAQREPGRLIRRYAADSVCNTRAHSGVRMRTRVRSFARMAYRRRRRRGPRASLQRRNLS